MKISLFFITVICIYGIAVTLAWAGNDGFATSKEEIITGLTHETPEKPMSRGLTRGLTRGYSPIHNESDSRTRSIVIREKHKEQIIEKQIMVSETDPTPRVNLTIEFDRDSCAIRPVSFSLLDALGQALGDAALADKPVMIVGHADADGPDAYNLALSMNRALAVKYYLQGRYGVPESRVRAVGFGEAVPIAPNTTPENKQKNRRVEVRLDQGAW